MHAWTFTVFFMNGTTSIIILVTFVLKPNIYSQPLSVYKIK